MPYQLLAHHRFAPTNPFLPHTRWKRKSFVTAGKTWLVNVMSGQGVTSGYKGFPGSIVWEGERNGMTERPVGSENSGWVSVSDRANAMSGRREH